MEPGGPGQAERGAEAQPVCRTPRDSRPASHSSRTRRRHSLALPYTHKMLAQVGPAEFHFGQASCRLWTCPAGTGFEVGVMLRPLGLTATATESQI